jgi:hypothetical protein
MHLPLFTARCNRRTAVDSTREAAWILIKCVNDRMNALSTATAAIGTVEKLSAAISIAVLTNRGAGSLQEPNETCLRLNVSYKSHLALRSLHSATYHKSSLLLLLQGVAYDSHFGPGRQANPLVIRLPVE